MMKRTHMATGLLISIPLIASSPMAALGLLGSTAADYDFTLGIKHRTITHSLLAMSTTTTFIYFFNTKIAFVWGLNYLSHLILDSCTKMGVPFLYPFSCKYFGLKLIKTGSRAEYFILLLLVYSLINIFLRY